MAALAPRQTPQSQERRSADRGSAPKRVAVSKHFASPGTSGLSRNTGAAFPHGGVRPWHGTTAQVPLAPLARPLQRKLKIGDVDDPFERLAEQMAQRVAAGPGHLGAISGGSLLQRQCACGGQAGPSGECEACKQKRLQRQASGRAAAGAAPAIVHDTLRSPGRPLDGGARASMEARFGHDFAAVRVHTDERAAQSAVAVNALAYTVGHHVVFGSGQYDPQSAAGSRLLAHELTHVLQQGGAADQLQRQSSDPSQAVTPDPAQPVTPDPSQGVTPDPTQGGAGPTAGGSCTPTAKFITIPRTRLQASFQGDMFGAPVTMVAQFKAPEGCDCHCGEYRQFVRGFFKQDGVDVTAKEPFCSGPMSPTVFLEDCSPNSALPGGQQKYGYRSLPWSTASMFSKPDQATGCQFNGTDFPGWKLGSGAAHHFEVHLDFQSKLVDACNKDAVLAQANWGLDGDGIGQG